LNYQVLDSGEFEKLEQIGQHKIIRPSLNSAYKKSKPEIWKDISAHYKKNERGSGSWTYLKKIPDSFLVQFGNLTANLKFTPFGHIGVFPEQEKNWNLIENLGSIKNDFEVINLFAYSGMSTLAALNTGYSICHVDSSKGMISWAKENATSSGLIEKKVRWIEDDVLKFLKREVKRKKIYKGFILDPPSFGRGAKGEVWKIETDLIPLLVELMNLCNHSPEFIILSCHSTGFSPLTLSRILESYIKIDGKHLSKELYIEEKFGKKLPAGFCSYFFSKNFKSLEAHLLA
jgi:23S rRNA (cytosine1962-C5)-methyltransferase